MSQSRRSTYTRTYSAREVAAYVHRFGHPEETIDSMEGRLQYTALKWKRTRLLVADLRSNHDDEPCENVREYIERRRLGSRFPAIVVHDPRYTPLDGNHRLRAAKCVGDMWIDAFVPA